MLEELLRNEYNRYIESKAKEYIGPTGKCVDDVIYDDDFIDTVEEDLTEVGFTSEEASGIAIASFANETVMYKMLAYCFLLQEPFDSVETLKAIINDSDVSDLKDFSDDNLSKIVEASKKINY